MWSLPVIWPNLYPATCIVIILANHTHYGRRNLWTLYLLSSLPHHGIEVYWGSSTQILYQLQPSQRKRLTNLRESSEVLGKSEWTDRRGGCSATRIFDYAPAAANCISEFPIFFNFLFCLFLDLRLTVNLMILIESKNRLSRQHATRKIIYFHPIVVEPTNQPTTNLGQTCFPRKSKFYLLTWNPVARASHSENSVPIIGQIDNNTGSYFS